MSVLGVCVCDMHAWMHHRSMSVSGMYVLLVFLVFGGNIH